MRAVTALSLLLLACGGYVNATTSTSDKNTDFSSRCFSPYLKSALPDQERLDNESFVEDLRAVFALGDPTVEGDPKCGNVEPVLTLDSTTDSNGCDIDISDESNPTLDCTLTDTTLNGHTSTVTGGNSVGSSVQDQFDWTVTSSGGGGDPVAVPTGSILVDCDGGNDSFDGWPHSERVRTLGRAQALTGGTTGQDVYVLEGTTCDDQSFTVDWDGTSGDRVVFGAYKLVGGQPQVGLTDAGDLSARPDADEGTRPEINGTFPEPTCDGDDACDISGGLEYFPQIRVTSDYVTVQDLAIHDAPGRPIEVKDAPNTTTAPHILRNSIRYYGNQPIFLQEVVDGLVYGNSVQKGGIIFQYDYTDWPNTIRPGGVTVYRSSNADTLVEGNYVDQVAGEAFNCLYSSNVIFRRNVAGTYFSVGYYLDMCEDSVVESNIAYGGPHTTNGWGRNAGNGAAGGPGGGIVVAVEVANNSATGNLIRNNLVVGTSSCLEFNILSGELGGAKLYGNTCLGTFDTTSVASIGGANPTEAVFRNNIFYGTGTTSPSCPAAFDMDYNLWQSAPSDGDCTGSNDVTGDPNTATIWSTLDDQTFSDLPVQADFEIVDATAADDVGVNLTGTACLNEVNYATALANMTTLDITTAQWEFCLYEDFSGEARDGGLSEDMGALANP